MKKCVPLHHQNKLNLKRILSMKKIKKIYESHATVTADDGVKRTVMVVGLFEQTREYVETTQEIPVQVKPLTVVTGKVSYPVKKLHRVLTLGAAICHPDDEFDVEEGLDICLSRIHRGEDVGVIETSSSLMLTEDNIMANIESKLAYICNNIDKYLPNV